MLTLVLLGLMALILLRNGSMIMVSRSNRHQFFAFSLLILKKMTIFARY